MKRPVVIGRAQGRTAGKQIGNFRACFQPMLEKRLQQGERGSVALVDAIVPAMAIVVVAAEQPGANRVWPRDQARGGAAF